jgi:hypothetical protein
MPIANWKTAADISTRYLVGEQRLLAYAERGNLPLFRRPDGVVLFDESVVALYFRPRSAATAANDQSAPSPNGLGIIGLSRLGEAPPVERRRKGRVARADWPATAERRKKTG